MKTGFLSLAVTLLWLDVYFTVDASGYWPVTRAVSASLFFLICVVPAPVTPAVRRWLRRRLLRPALPDRNG